MKRGFLVLGLFVFCMSFVFAATSCTGDLCTIYENEEITYGGHTFSVGSIFSSEVWLNVDYNNMSLIFRSTGEVKYERELEINLTKIAYATKENMSSYAIFKIYESVCNDSDGGLNYYTKGNAFKGVARYSDYCSGNVLLEARCYNGLPSIYNYTCPNGCSNGACLQPNTIRCYNDSGCSQITSVTPPYCNMSQSCYTSQTPKCLNPGTINSSCSWVSTLKCTNCPNGCSSNGICNGSMASCSESNASGILTFHQSINLTIANTQYNLYFEGYGASASAPYWISMKINGQYREFNSASSGAFMPILLADGTILRLYYDYNARSIRVCLYAVQKLQCTDSDGGDSIYQRGYRSYGSLNESDFCVYDPIQNGSITADKSKWVSTCAGPNCFIIEQHCNSNLSDTFKRYSCPNGCTNGTCSSIPLVNQCNDSDDGKNYFVRGKVSSVGGYYGVESGVDGCLNSNFQSNEVTDFQTGNTIHKSSGVKISEVFCGSNNLYDHEIVDCEFGCYDGACIKQDQDIPCSVNATHCGNSSPRTLAYGKLVVGDVWTGTEHKKHLMCTIIEAPQANRSWDFEQQGCAIVKIVESNTSSNTSSCNCPAAATEQYCNMSNVCYKENIYSCNISTKACIATSGMTRCAPCQNGCSGGNCIVKNESSSNGTPTFEVKILTPGELCEGCMIGEKCYSMGYRKSGKFCAENQSFIGYQSKGTTCDNNFECSSNLCVESECVSGGLFKSVMNWFKRIFTKE